MNEWMNKWILQSARGPDFGSLQSINQSTSRPRLWVTSTSASHRQVTNITSNHFPYLFDLNLQRPRFGVTSRNVTASGSHVFFLCWSCSHLRWCWRWPMSSVLPSLESKWWQLAWEVSQRICVVWATRISSVWCGPHRYNLYGLGHTDIICAVRYNLYSVGHTDFIRVVLATQISLI